MPTKYGSIQTTLDYRITEIKILGLMYNYDN